MTRRNFLDGNDVMKAEVFTNNESHWTPIRDKVEAWVKAGWKDWKVEKPEWFTDDWKAIVPEEMIPKKSRGEDGEREGEGSSVAVIPAGVRLARRRSSVPMLISAALRIDPVSNKIAPAGNVKIRDSDFDAEDFVRELKRRGSINL
ncbi:hypothetical protein TrLO_g702 [Triparma laevis f. longispina]|nr:hypothetical protein TrLO_g702 [Triparma laevis f. longispina]